MAEFGLQEVETYVYCHHNTVKQLIATMPIMYLCMEAQRCLVLKVYKRWWEQDGLDLEETWTAAQEAERTDEEEEMDRTVAETE